MTLNVAIMQLVELHEHSMMPEFFKPAIENVIDTISELEEPAQPHWIPCSERLPLIEENPVLVSWMGLVNIGWYNPIDGWTTGTRFNADEVDAWMKLPEPYTEV